VRDYQREEVQDGVQQGVHHGERTVVQDRLHHGVHHSRGTEVQDSPGTVYFISFQPVLRIHDILAWIRGGSTYYFLKVN
jgi:hypothetical protein